jgi:hypothetical protein
MQFKSTLQKFDGPVWGHHVPVPTDIARQFIDGDNRRVVCTLMGSAKLHGAILPMGEGEWFFNVNQPTCKKLGLILGQEVDIHIEKDTSDYGMPMPDELRELMDQDEEGSVLFHKLTPGKQRNLIYIAAQPKNPDIRIRRSIVILNHLKSQDGVIDFKQLNAEIKAANQAARGM